MNSHTFFRNADMMSDEGIVLTQTSSISIDAKCFIGELAAETAISKQVSDSTFNINPAINSCSTCCPGNFIEIFFFGIQMHRQCFQHPSPLVERHLPQLYSAGTACIVEHFPEIESFTAGRCNNITVNRIVQELTIAFAGHPLTAVVIL